MEIQFPQSLLPDSVFDVVIKIPYDSDLKQCISMRKRGSLNVGATLILHKDFKWALRNRLLKNLRFTKDKLFIWPTLYRVNRLTTLVVAF